MKANKLSLITFANNEEAVHKVDHDITASFVLRSVARGYEEEAAEILKKHHVSVGEGIMLANLSDKIYQRYVDTLNLGRIDKGKEFLYDSDKVIEIIEKHMPDILKELIKFIN